MNFSVCLIARNEAKTLPRLISSLKEFQERGGEILLLDTGSTDNTVEVANSLGCITFSVGDKFRITIDDTLAKNINDDFCAGEEPIVREGESLFDYASARNYIAQFAKNDMLATPDCDEIYTKLDLDKIQKAIKDGVEQLEYNFVFSHDANGNEDVKFLHSKFYDRRKLSWKGIIHEVLSGNARKQFFGEDIIKLEHYQNVETNRSGYLRGLALDFYKDKTNDRNAHYFGRELMYTGRYKSAIKQLKRHVEMNGWSAEAAQSLIFIGDCYKALAEDPTEWYFKAILKDGGRREAYLRLAEYFYGKNDLQRAASFAMASLAIKQGNYYADRVEHYTYKPHEILYLTFWWLGDKIKSREHFFKALAFDPRNPKFLHDRQFYEHSQ